jgi:hypothetical protein
MSSNAFRLNNSEVFYCISSDEDILLILNNAFVIKIDNKQSFCTQFSKTSFINRFTLIEVLGISFLITPLDYLLQ